MRYDTALGTLCALAAAADAATIQKRSFTVNRVANPDFTGRNGPLELAKAYSKYGIPMPDGLKATMDKHIARRELRQMARRNELDDIIEFLNGNKDRQGKGGGLRGNGNGNAGNGNGNGNAGNGNGNTGNGNGNGSGSRNGNGNAGSGNRGNRGGSRNGNGGNAGVRNQTGQVAANPENNEAEFISPIKIGGQTVNLDFDTGSSDLWVFNTQLSAAANQGHNVYDPSKSQTAQQLQGATFNVSYGDGSAAAGVVGLDTVDVGGAVVANQAVELATAVTASFAQNSKVDGLMGLAFSKLNTVKPQKQATFFDNVKSTLAEPLFAADLRRGAAGSYTFGAVNASSFQGNLAWIPVDSAKGFWQFGSQSFAVNGGQAQPATQGGQAIADTGTTLILADQNIAQGYYSQVQGAQSSQQGFVFPCSAQLPDLDLDIGGVYMAKISGKDINFAPLNDGKTCFGGVQAVPAGSLAIYGDIMFKSQYVAFNGGNNSLGMAPHA